MNLAQRLEALGRATQLTAGRIPPQIQLNAHRLVEHANRRLAAGPQTVVALAGATGSGKSTLFNALSEATLAEQGARRPTTAEPLAVSFAPTNAELLGLLGVTRRREATPPIPEMADLVLLDLPDHDSTAVAHRAAVDQLVGLVDQFVWVLDPQKYADAAVHRRYLSALTQHRDVICVVLNQTDRLTEHDLAACLAHLHRLLADDGLAGVPVFTTSALLGHGVAELRDHLVHIAQEKRATVTRLSADVTLQAAALREALGEGRTRPVDEAATQEFTETLAIAAGVPTVVEAVRATVRHRATRNTGWPPTSWLASVKPDPLRRLRLGGAQSSDGVIDRTSLPAPSAAVRSQLSIGLRGLAEHISEGMPLAWQEALHDVVHQAQDELPGQLDRAVAAVDLDVDREPMWWSLVRGVHWVLLVVAAVGLLWLLLGLVVPALPMAPIEGIALPTVLLGGALAAAALLKLCTVGVIKLAAARAGRRAQTALTAAVAEVARTTVLAPAQAEAARYRQAREVLATLR